MDLRWMKARIVDCIKAIPNFINSSFDEYTKLKKEQMEEMVKANKAGDDKKVRRIVEKF